MDKLVELVQFNDIYKGKRVLITGHTGFKGSWLALWLQELGAEVYGVSLSGKGNSEHFESLKLSLRSYEADIRDANGLNEIIKEISPDIVFHLAAQAIVRKSFLNPVETYETNVIGTLNVFEAVRKLNRKTVIINITSDKVYKNKEWNWPYREIDELGGFDPYSSSKAMSELLTDSFRNSFFNINEYTKTHNILLATARAGNVIGGGDWAMDRIVPDIFRAVIANKSVEIRNPVAVRPWQYVLEPLSGYLLLGSELLAGNLIYAKEWNFGPDNTANLTVLSLVKEMQKVWERIKLEVTNNDGPHEAGILKLDSSLSRSELKWIPVFEISKTIEITTKWYQEYIERKKIISKEHLNYYVSNAYNKSVSWIKRRQS